MPEPVRIERVVPQHVDREHHEQRLVGVVERWKPEIDSVESHRRGREQDQAQQHPVARFACPSVTDFGARFRPVHKAKDVEQRCKP